MTQFDVFYRAFCDYRKQTLDNTECKKNRRKFRTVDNALDKIESIRLHYTIEEDWILAIEKGLIYVDKALREERQFIRSSGEVVPIEKAKKVSKASVEHLARHSNLIVHLPKEKNAPIVPDNIFIVEKLSDFTVYENRFLYMLLSYLRDFINLRLEKITEIANTYRGYMTMKKVINDKVRSITYETNFFEERKDNPYPLENKENEALLKRIESLANIVAVYLQMPLMVEVAKAPMIKPPVVKTNVLKMNTNFKTALELYEFVSTYPKEGFTYEEVKTTYNPFPNDIGDEVMELISLTSFLTYEHGNGLKQVFQESYEEEEKKRKEEEGKNLASQIKNLRRRVDNSGTSLEEYMLLLEKRNRMLEADHSLLLQANEIIVKQNESIEQLNNVLYEKEQYISAQDSIIKEKEEALITMKEEHTKALLEKDRICQEEISHMKNEYLEKSKAQEAIYVKENTKLIATIDAKKVELEQKKIELSDFMQKKEEYTREMIKEHAEKIAATNKDCEEKLNALTLETNEKIKALTLECDERIKDLSRECDEKIKVLSHEKYLAKAQLDGLRKLNNLITDQEDFTSMERFEELEYEYEAFKKLFKDKWKETKRRIRREILWKDLSDNNIPSLENEQEEKEDKKTRIKNEDKKAKVKNEDKKTRVKKEDEELEQ